MPVPETLHICLDNGKFLRYKINNIRRDGEPVPYNESHALNDNLAVQSFTPQGVILSEVEGSFRLQKDDAKKILRLASLAQNDTLLAGDCADKR